MLELISEGKYGGCNRPLMTLTKENLLDWMQCCWKMSYVTR